VVAAGKAVLRLARFEAFAGLVPLVEHEGWLTAEPDALGLRIGSAARCAFVPLTFSRNMFLLSHPADLSWRT
jgi:hypothetical protein